MSINFPPQMGRVIYEYDYFAGSQVMVYFDDVLVDDICRIAWGVTQNRQPIYGYASQYWAAVAAGVVIGGGSFWIAFKEAVYIPAILSHIGSRRDGSEDVFPSPARLPEDSRLVTSSLARSANIFEGTVEEGDVRQSGSIIRANIERTLHANTQNPDDAETQARLMQYAANIAALPDREFENMAEFFEDAVWYGGGSAGENRGRTQAASGNWSGGETNEETLLAHRRADQYPPFDIIVTFGDINTAASNHTVIRLTDVIISDTKFVGIEATGEPIAVQYDFIFRN